MWLQASWGLHIGFVVLPALVLAAFVWGVATATRRSGEDAATIQSRTWMAAAGAVSWFVLTGLLGASGILQRFDRWPPPFMLAVLPTLILVVMLAFSPFGKRLAMGLPIAALVGFQAFRLPLELAMHRAVTEGIMPVQMSYSGWNYDIVTGASALVVAYLLRRTESRGLLMAWNLLGTILLAVIIGVAVASTPFLHAFGTAPAQLNTFVTFAPFVWLPLILVPAALFGHLLVWRRLFGRA